MNSLEIFNSGELYHYTENDLDLAAQLLKMSVQDLPDFIEKAKASLKDKNVEKTFHHIHSIKGIAGTTGALRVHSVSLHCEHLIKTNPDDRNIESEIKNLEEEIRAFCSCQEVLDLMDLHV